MGFAPPSPPIIKPTGIAIVRAAVLPELALVVRVDKLSLPQPWNIGDYRRFLRRGEHGYGVAVAFIQSRIVGFVAYEQQSEQAIRLLRIGVLPECRGVGVGQSLLDFVAHVGRKSGCKRLIALSSEAADKTHSFFQKCGLRSVNVYTLQKFEPADNPVGYRGALYHFVKPLA